MIASACAGSSSSTASPDTGAEAEATATLEHTPQSTGSPPIVATPTATAALSPEQLQTLRPNELGQVPILMYHLIGPEPEQFVRTPDQLRTDLQWLYEHDFVVVPLRDYVSNTIDIPAGKRPVVLTFDDSSASQFRLTPLENGQYALDPECAVGILEIFFSEHPDFGRGGYFAVNSYKLFDWDPLADESEQTAFAGVKIQWLLDNGYEIGNHTLEHANLGELSDEEIKYQLAANDDAVKALAPGARIEVITLPYGAYPSGGDDRLLRGFSYQERLYQWSGALLVGANPANSPISTEFDPFETARIQAFDDELSKWFETFVAVPEILYVSDGNPGLITVPNDLHPQLAGTLNEGSVGDRELVRY